MKRPDCYRTLLFGFICLFLHVHSSHAQQTDPDIDSLKQELLMHTEQDSSYVMTMLKLASKLKYSDPGQAADFAQRGIDISQKLENNRLLASSLNLLGIAYSQQSDYAKAIPAFKQALAHASKAKLPTFLGQIRNNLGSVYKNLADYSSCLSEYLKAEKIYLEHDYSLGIAMISNNLGNLYKRIKQPDKAVEHYKKALQAYKVQQNANGYASAQINLGIFYMETAEDYESARILLDSALQYYSQNKQTVREVLALNALGGLHRRLKNYEKASSLLHSAQEKAHTNGLVGSSFSILTKLARVASAKGNLDESLDLIAEASSIADSTENIDRQSFAAFTQSEIFREHDRWEEAMKYYKQYKGLEDSIFSKQQQTLYQSLQVQREAYQREEQLKAQALQLNFLEEQVSLENKWKWSLAAACLFLLFAGVLYYQKYRDRKIVATKLESRNRLITAQKAEIEALDKTKNRFFTNISHEFRTPLNLILGPLRSGKDQIPSNELGMMQRNAERLLRLINQLLDLSKLETGLLELHYENADLNKYLRDLASVFELQAQQKNPLPCRHSYKRTTCTARF